MKLLFHLSQFNTGGGEMSTLRLLRALQARGAEITLVLTEGGGSLENRLDPDVEVIRLRPGRRPINWFHRALRGGIGLIAGIRLLRRRFDVGIVGMTGASTWLVRYVVRAPTKVHFIRNDLSKMRKRPQIITTVKRNFRAFSAFICVSQVARDSLVSAVPEAVNKTYVIYNIFDVRYMLDQIVGAPDPFPDRRPGTLRILSVCRLNEHAKGLVRMSRVARRLVDAGLDFDWFIVGDGPDRELLESMIIAQGIEKNMHLLGRFENPFPAYLSSDLVAMLSNYEGLCGVVNEAKIMGRAVVATRVSGVEEQLIHGETGLIVEQNEEDIFTALHRLLTDDSLREQLTNDQLPQALLADDAKVERLWQLFERGSLQGV